MKFEDFQPGYEISRTFEITPEAIDAYADVTGDRNPLHMSDKFAREAGFRGRVAHGMYMAGLLSRIIGEDIPGHGALWFAQDINFQEPVYVGDVVTITVRVVRRSVASKTLGLEVKAFDQNKILKFHGKGKVTMPAMQKKSKQSMRTALVIGGSGGIGASVSKMLASSGFRVVVSYAHDRIRAANVASVVKSTGGECSVVKLDLAETGSIKTAVKSIHKQFGFIDTVVFCAVNEWRRKKFQEINAYEFEEDYKVSVVGAAVVLQQVLPSMVDAGFGRVIAVASSVVNGIPPSEQASYVAAKYGMVGLIKSLSVEYAGSGITFNLVSPSLVDTDLTRDLSERVRKAMILKSPMRRLCSPDDVAGVISLLSQSESYINGANIPIDGGV